jgi:hypothetical protein
MVSFIVALAQDSGPVGEPVRRRNQDIESWPRAKITREDDSFRVAARIAIGRDADDREMLPVIEIS